MPKDAAASGIQSASTADIKAALGALDESDLLEIAALRPTMRDIEEAAIRLSGDCDVFGAGTPLNGIADKIVTILSQDEDEEDARSH